MEFNFLFLFYFKVGRVHILIIDELAFEVSELYVHGPIFLSHKPKLDIFQFFAGDHLHR